MGYNQDKPFHKKYLNPSPGKLKKKENVYDKE
jgi:hypothetical protein